VTNKSGYFLTDEYIPRVKVFLIRIKAEIDAYYSEYSHWTNYEDIYYLVSQITDNEDGEYDNPVLKPLIDKSLLISNRYSINVKMIQIRNGHYLILLMKRPITFVMWLWHSLSTAPNDLTISISLAMLAMKRILPVLIFTH